MTMTTPECLFCKEPGGDILLEDALCRVALIDGAEGVAYPGYCRVIWHRHVREMSDLPAIEQQHFFKVVMAVEQALRNVQQPDKVNLASLGNVVPHLHWHVIPRWRDDCNFPSPIWATAQRPGNTRLSANAGELRKALHAALKDAT